MLNEQANAAADDIISTLLDYASDAAWVASITAIQANQHSHERAWHAARQLIEEKYATKRRLNKLLTGAGGAEGVATAQLEADEVRELRAYDEKVRMVMLRMYAAQQDELRKLGVKVLKDEAAMQKVYCVLEELVAKQ